MRGRSVEGGRGAGDMEVAAEAERVRDGAQAEGGDFAFGFPGKSAGREALAPHVPEFAAPLAEPLRALGSGDEK